MPDLAQLAEDLVKRAGDRGVTLATAESCTAGRLATLLADAPGAGKLFHGGIVAYSKEQKSAVLGVDPGLIARETAVSRAVAEAMAAGVLASSPADIGAAITGVAGPEPDEDGNPVGLMHVAVAARSGLVRHREVRLPPGDREALREAAMRHALELLGEAVGG